MIREVASEALERVGLLDGIMALRRRARTPWLTVLTYHRVVGPGGVGLLDGDVAVTAELFERQIEVATRFFSPVGIEQLFAARGGAPLPPSPLMVTLDDGYRDGFDVALPLLRKHGVPAVYFIATAFVEQRRLFWWDRIHYLVNSSRREALALGYPRPMRLPLGPEPGARAVAIHALLAVVKTHFALDVPRFLDEVESASGASLGRETERRLADEHVMTWDQVRALRAAGMAVQSHTHGHRVVQTLPASALFAELLDARLRLESVLGEPVRAVSYPVGRAPMYSARVRGLVRAAGYELAFSNRSGINPCAGFDALDVRRMSLEEVRRDAHIKAVMAVPQLAY